MSEDYRVRAQQRAAIERSLGGGLIGYLTRLRSSHQVTVTKQGDRLGVCICGSPGCSVAVLLFHIDSLRRDYEAKVEDFIRETMNLAAANTRADKAEAERDRLRVAVVDIRRKGCTGACCASSKGRRRHEHHPEV